MGSDGIGTVDFALTINGAFAAGANCSLDRVDFSPGTKERTIIREEMDRDPM